MEPRMTGAFDAEREEHVIGILGESTLEAAIG
jgi:hypothetical protein